MKRLLVTLQELAARDNLALAAFKAARGKHSRPGVAAFLADLDARLDSLAHGILGEAAPSGQQRQFVIRDPKRRTITAACFADRVLHHAILNLTEARFEQALAPSVYACRRGRGVHAAVAAVQRGLQRHGWAVQVDVEGFFPSIDHAVLRDILARRFKGQAFLSLLGRIIDAGASSAGGTGLPIGALTSQHFANAYLGSADRLLFAHGGVHDPVRYMDDIVWFSPSREAAIDSLATLQDHLATVLNLRLKPSVVLQPAARGLRFCGFRVKPGVILASPRKLARYRAARTRLLAAEAAGTPEPLLQRAHSGSVAALLPAASLMWRRQLWWPCDADKVPL